MVLQCTEVPIDFALAWRTTERRCHRMVRAGKPYVRVRAEVLDFRRDQVMMIVTTELAISSTSGSCNAKSMQVGKPTQR